MARENVSNGSRGKDAFDAQRALNKFHIQSLMGNGPGLSRAPLREDSIFGSDSTAALNGFKDAVGLPTDGTADNDTWSELEKFVPEDIAAQDAL